MADVKYVATSDFEKVKRDYAALARSVSKVEEENRRLKRTTQETGQARRESFGSGALAEVKNFAIGLGSITTAVGLATRAFAELRQEKERALEGLGEAQPTAARLAQVATDRADFDRLLARRDVTAARFGLPVDTVGNLLFSARSENFEQDFTFLAGATRLLGSQAIAGVAGQLPTIFQQEGLTPTQSVAMTLAAARGSRDDFQALGLAAPVAAQAARGAGATSSEVLAAQAVLASTFGSARASQRINAFLGAVELDPGLRGRGLRGAVGAIGEMTEAERADFLGENKELNAAFNALQQNLTAINATMTDINQARRTAGTAEGPVVRALDILFSTEGTTAQQQLNEAQIQRAIAERQLLGPAAAREATMAERVRGFLLRAPIGRFSRAFGSMAVSGAQGIGAEEMEIAMAGAGAAGFVETAQLAAAPGMTVNRFVSEYLRQITGNLDEIAQNTRRTPAQENAGQRAEDLAETRSREE